METLKHQLLKEQAKELLIKNGFKENEIFMEYTVKIHSRRKYVIDVAGINLEKKTFIECGMLCGENRIEILNKLCDKVIHLPYPKNTIISSRMRHIKHINIELPEELHDKLRHASIDRKKEMHDIVIEAIRKEVM